MVKCGVFFVVRTELLNIILTSFSIRRQMRRGALKVSRVPKFPSMINGSVISELFRKLLSVYWRFYQLQFYSYWVRTYMYIHIAFHFLFCVRGHWIINALVKFLLCNICPTCSIECAISIGPGCWFCFRVYFNRALLCVRDTVYFSWRITVAMSTCFRYFRAQIYSLVRN
jgi:hypothetical protein